jgi:hypothetical protein
MVSTLSRLDQDNQTHRHDPELSSAGGRRASGQSGRATELFGLAIGISILAACALNQRLTTDVFWQLAAGQWIIAHHAMPGVDAFSYTEPHRRWIADEWGSEIALATTFKLLGVQAYAIFAIVTGALCLICTRAYARALGARGGRVAAVTVLVAYGIADVIVQDRGESFSLIWLPLELLILTRARTNPRWLWALPPLFVCWVNTHGSILLGLLVVGIELAWAIAPTRWLSGVSKASRSPFAVPLAWASVGGVLACCLTPYGPGLLRDDLAVTSNPQIGAYIEEWMSPNFHSVSTLVAYLVPIVLIVAVVRSRRPLPALEISLALAMVLAALHSGRFVVYLFIAAAGLAATMPARAPWSAIGRHAVGAIGVGVMVAVLALPGVPAGSVAPSTPVQAFDFLSTHPGRIFTEYTWADYSIARGRATFADGRTDYFSGTVLTQFFDIANLSANPDPLLARYDVRYVVWDPGTPLYTYLTHDPHWKVVDRAGPAVVFRRQ